MPHERSTVAVGRLAFGFVGTAPINDWASLKSFAKGPLLLGAMTWGGLYARDPRIRAILPLIREPTVAVFCPSRSGENACFSNGNHRKSGRRNFKTVDYSVELQGVPARPLIRRAGRQSSLPISS